MTWYTSITNIQPNRIVVRGHNIEDLIGKASFGEVVYLLLKGKKPTEKEAQMIEAILVSSVDHGPTPPSCLAARTVASCGVSVSSALAAGILSIGRIHGGAIESCMKSLTEAIKKKQQTQETAVAVAGHIIKEAKEKGERLAGFGHRIHSQDPRTVRLLELARQLGLAGAAIEMAQAMVSVFDEQGKSLPLNVDGTIAAILVDLGFSPRLGNAFFIISRVPGLIAHISEEQSQEKPMRVIEPKDWEYKETSQAET